MSLFSATEEIRRRDVSPWAFQRDISPIGHIIRQEDRLAEFLSTDERDGNLGRTISRSDEAVLTLRQIYEEPPSTSAALRKSPENRLLDCSQNGRENGDGYSSRRRRKIEAETMAWLREVDGSVIDHKYKVVALEFDLLIALSEISRLIHENKIGARALAYRPEGDLLGEASQRSYLQALCRVFAETPTWVWTDRDSMEERFPSTRTTIKSLVSDVRLPVAIPRSCGMDQYKRY